MATFLVGESYLGGACGNSIVGIFSTIVSGVETNVYTYSNNTTVAGGNLTFRANYGCAAGNSTVGIFTDGSNGRATNIYTYSNNTVARGTSLLYLSAGEAAISNYNP